MSRAEIALRWLRYIERKGWGKAENHDGSGSLSLDFRFMDRTKGYCEDMTVLRSNPSSLEMMERIVKEVPSRVVARLIKDVADRGTDWRRRQLN